MMPLWTTTILPVQSRCGWAFSSVGRPWVAQRVWPTPYSPRERVELDDLLEVRQLAGAAPQVDRAVADDRHAGRVVAAVFELPQAVDEDRHDVFGSDVADDSAHMAEFPGPISLALVLLLLFDPALDIPLLAGADRQRARRHVLPDRRAGSDVGALADRDRRDELRVASDEGAVLDGGRVFSAPS